MKTLLPVLLALVGLLGGLLAGQMLKPVPEAPPAAPGGETDYATDPHAGEDAAQEDEEKPQFEYAKMDAQFVVPVMGEGRVEAMVVMSISLEVAAGTADEAHARGPKLRDGFLRVLFEHERAGGFSGIFTDTRMLDDLRGRLLQVAQGILGDKVNDVLVTDILRQDLAR